jgi:hypothetical protein
MKWRILAGVVLAVALGWSGWWIVGSQIKRSALEGWLAERRADGWVAEAEAISIGGFPNRFDTRVTGLHLADPGQGWAWETPFMDILMLSYQPNAAIVALPGDQQIAVPGAQSVLDAETLRGSVRFVPGPSLELAALSVEADALALRDARAASPSVLAAADRVVLHLRALDDGTAPENGYAMFAEAQAVRLPAALREILDPAGALAPVADRLEIDGRLAFDAPLDRHAVEVAPPGVTHLSLSQASLRWGELAIALSGAVTADRQGYAVGDLDLRAENWLEILAAMVRAGVIGEETAATLRFGLGFFARQRDGRSVLSVPLSFSGGGTRIGPIPVGPAPRLRRP